MKRKERIEKGCYGYRNRRTFRNALASALIFAVLILLVAAGRRTGGTAGMLLLFFGILCSLPLANTLSPLIALGRYRTPARAFYEQVRQYENRGLVLYDLVFPTEEKAFAADALVVRGGVVLVYIPEKERGIETAGRKHLERQLRLGKAPCAVHPFTDLTQFLRALERLPKYEAVDASGRRSVSDGAEDSLRLASDADLLAAEVLCRISY